jgi:hypothetical protein
MMTASLNNGTTPTNNTATSNHGMDVFRPVVFQCKHCRSIVADSADLASTDAQQRLLAFRRPAHPNISVKQEWQVSANGQAVFQGLACRGCGLELGVRYQSTSVEMDHLRGMMTLRTECLNMYELCFDNDKVKRDIEETFKSQFPIAGAVNGSTTTTSGTGNVDSVEITKLQKFCLVLYDRVVRLEERVLQLSDQRR